jgi:hypothetical protein
LGTILTSARATRLLESGRAVKFDTSNEGLMAVWLDKVDNSTLLGYDAVVLVYSLRRMKAGRVTETRKVFLLMCTIFRLIESITWCYRRRQYGSASLSEKPADI